MDDRNVRAAIDGAEASESDIVDVLSRGAAVTDLLSIVAKSATRLAGWVGLAALFASIVDAILQGAGAPARGRRSSRRLIVLQALWRDCPPARAPADVCLGVQRPRRYDDHRAPRFRGLEREVSRARAQGTRPAGPPRRLHIDLSALVREPASSIRAAAAAGG